MAFPPSVSDGITDGVTVSNDAFWAAYDAEVLAALQDVTSGGGAGSVQTPALTTAEVRDARDGEASLLAKLTAMEAAFSGAGPSALRNGFVLGNLLANDVGMMWSRGPSAAPDYYVLSGTGAAVAQCGSGLADTTSVNDRDTSFSAKVTFGSDAAALSQYIFPTALGAALDEFFASKYTPSDASAVALSGYGGAGDLALQVFFLMHVWCDGASRARIRLTGSSPVTSNYHSGNSTWQALMCGPMQVVLGTPIQAQCRVETAGAAYFQSGSVIIAESGMPPMFVPAKTRLVTYPFDPVIATPLAATGYGYVRPMHPFFPLALAADVLGNVPTGGTTLKLDLMTPVGGTFVSLFAALPAFVASDRHLYKPIDTAVANYRRRTIRGNYAAGGAANLADNSVLRLDVNARDSGNTATNIKAHVIGLEYDRPLDQFRAADDLGEA